MADIDILMPIKEPIFATFNADEDAAWDGLVRNVNSYYTVNGRGNLISPEYWNALKKVAKNAKAILNVGNFDGMTPQTGYGARPIWPEDVSSATLPDTFTEWDATAAMLGVTNTPAVTGGDRRVWFGDNGVAQNGTVAGQLYANQYLAANTDIVPRDVQQDNWGVALVGAIDLLGSGTVRSINVSQNGEHKGEYWFEHQMRANAGGLNTQSIPIVELGEVVWFPPGFKFSAGVRVRRTVGATAFSPIGLTFGTSLRIRRSTLVATAGATTVQANRGTRAS